ncbi:unannotated protein [freshwater metagenome]|uniref:Unannotated protein n=1 Tax=freshwater metagenome TaxID=449393 RepID=A0A6J6XU90_9ZZZZ
MRVRVDVVCGGGSLERHGLYVHGDRYERGRYGCFFCGLELGDPRGAGDCAWCADDHLRGGGRWSGDGVLVGPVVRRWFADNGLHGDF